MKATETMTNFMNVLKIYEEDSTTYADTCERLRETCGIILGADEDFYADTGAVSGYNAGGSVVKDAQSIVPEPDGASLANLSLPAAGSTTSHSYTGDDGNSFTFNIKWKNSFAQVRDVSTYEEIALTDDYSESYISAEQISSGIQTIAKGVENFWIEETFKLVYDSFELDFGGKTLDISFDINADYQAATGSVEDTNGFLRWLCQENLSSEVVFGTSAEEVFDYYGDYWISSSSGDLLLRDAADKTVSFVDNSGTLKAKISVASGESYDFTVYDSSELLEFDGKIFLTENANATFNINSGEVVSISNFTGKLSGFLEGDYIVNDENFTVSENDMLVSDGESTYLAQENEESGGGDGSIPGGSSEGGGSSSVSWSGTTEITAATIQSGQTYTSTTADENALLINTDENVRINNPTVQKTGDSDGGDNCNFYGINSGVMVLGGGTTSIIGGTVTAGATGANGVFSYGGNGGTNGAAGDGTTIIISDTTITTTGSNSGGIMTTGGGKTVAYNLTITTSGGSSAPIRTDRGGGDVTVNGGAYTSNGLGSPAIYSTADIIVSNATLTSNLSEGVCIEGENSVALTNCTLTANNTSTNGNATFLDSIMIYQSQSGDAADGTSSFSMTGGVLNSNSGHVFHVTNTTAIINLEGVTINNGDSEGVLLSVSDDGWSGASNVATLNADSQTLTGDILVGDNSTLTLNLTNGTTFTGNVSGEISNASGEQVSTTVGTVNVSLDSSSKWYLSGDTYISSFSGTAANVITGDYSLYVNNVALDGTSESDEESDTEVTALNINNTVDNTLISGTAGNDTITNSGNNVTIQAGAGDDSVLSYGNNVVIELGEGNSTLDVEGEAGTTSQYVTVNTGDGDNYITLYSGSNHVQVNTGNGTNHVLTSDPNGEINTGSGEDYISLLTGADGTTVNSGAGNDHLSVVGSGVTINTGEGDDEIMTFRNALNITVNAGAGNDTITLRGGSGNVIEYSEGDGNDVIVGYTASHSIKIVDGEIASTSVDGSSVILSFDDGAITLTHGVNKTINIIDAEGNAIQTVFAGEDDEDTVNILNTIISGTDGNDTIVNDGSVVTIDAGAGDDSVINTGSSVEANLGDGNDTFLSNDGGNITVNTGAGNNMVSLQGNTENFEVNFGDGNNTIYSINKNTAVTGGDSGDLYVYYNGVEGGTIQAGDGDDTIRIGSTKTTIDAGDGNDLITLYRDAREVTVNGGAGDDSIVLYARDSDSSVGYVYEYGGGNDTIANIHPNDTIIAEGIGHVTTSDSNVVATLESGSITFAESSNLTVNISSGEGSTLFILNSSSDTLITGSDAGDSIISHAAEVTIDGGEGDDYIHAAASEGISVNGGAGNDTILGFSRSGTLNGGAGDDLITIYGKDIGAPSTLLVESSSGNDTIEGYTSVSTIQANVQSASVEGSNVILTTDEGTITILEVAGETLNLLDSDGSIVETVIGGKSITNSVDSATVTTGAGDDTIVNTNASNVLIDAGAGDDIISLEGGADNTLVASAGNDTVYGYTTDTAIQITGVETTVDGANVILTTEEGTLTLVDGSGIVKLSDSDGSVSTTAIIAKDETLTIDGITYTALDDFAQLNLDSDSKVSGIASGKVEAVIADSETSPTITFDGTTAFDFTAAVSDGNLQVDYSGLTVNYTHGEVTYTDGNISAESEVGIAGKFFELSYEVDLTMESSVTVTLSGDEINLEGTATGSLSMNGEESGTLSFSGELTYNQADNTVSLKKDATFGANMALLNDFGITVTALDDAGGSFTIDTSDSGVTFTPNEGEGALEVAISAGGNEFLSGELTTTKGSISANVSGQITLASDTEFTFATQFGTFTIGTEDEYTANINTTEGILTMSREGELNVAVMNNSGTTIFDGTIGISNGTIAVNPSDSEVTVSSGTTIAVTSNDMTLTATTTADLSGAVELGSNGTITFTPNAGDGGVAITITKDGVTENFGVISVLSGSMSYGLDGNITVASDTELQVVFSEDYSINFQTTGEAGGALKLVDGGINFVPSSENSSLNLSVTHGTNTRTTNLSVTGELTYYFADGEIALESGTVVTNTWENGYTLRIISSGGSSTMIFDPESGGLEVTSTDNSLTVELTTPNGIITTYDSFNGTLTYSAGSVVLKEGTSLSGTESSNGLEVAYEAVTGDTRITFGDENMTFTPIDGAVFETSYGENYSFSITGEGELLTYVGTEETDYPFSATSGLILNGAENFESATLLLLDSGTYTINSAEITSPENTPVYVESSDTVEFSADSGILFSDTTYSGNGTIHVEDNVASLIMTESGTATFEGTTFELGEDLSSGVSIAALSNGFEIAHVISQEEADDEDTTDDTDVGKVFAERISIDGDEVYTVTNDITGVKEISGLSSGAQVTVASIFDGEEDSSGTYFELKTDTDGVFTLGEESYTVTGDDSVTFLVRFYNDGTAELLDLYDLDSGGAVTGDNTVISAQEITNSDAAVVEATNYDDTINNTGNHATINALAGEDLITSNADNVYIDAGDGDDTVSAGGENLTIIGGDGDDVISPVSSNNAYIDAGAGDNLISITGNSSTIIAEDGADTIESSGNNVLIEAGAGDNSISASGSNITIESGSGNDYISLGSGSRAVTISSGAGNDTIDGYTSEVTLQAADLRNASMSGDNLVLRFNDRTLTIIDGKDQVINIANEDGAVTSEVVIGDFAIDGEATINGLTYTGEGNVNVSRSGITISGELAVEDAEDTSFVVLSASSVTIDNKTFDVSTEATITSTDYGFQVNNESITVAGDDSYSVEVGSAVTKISAISNGATVSSSRSYDVETDEQGTFTFGEKSYTITGDSSVVFGVNNDSVKTVRELDGTITGNFNNAPVAINDGATVSIAGDDSVDILSDGSTNIELRNLESTASARFGMMEAGAITLGTKVFELTDSSTSRLLVTSTENGFSAGSESVTVTGDRSYTVQSAGEGISSVVGISAGATIQGTGSYDVETDAQGQFTFGEKTYTVAGDNSVVFGVENNAVTSVDSLSGTISGDFTSAIDVNENEKSVWITGDSSVNVISSTATEIRGVGSGASVRSAGGAEKITTDEAGDFHFGTVNAQHYTITGDTSVNFELSNDTVAGVSNIDNATVTFGNSSIDASINGSAVSISSNGNNPALIIASGEITSVDNAQRISSLTGNTTVHGTGALTVNGAAIDVEVDQDFNVIVSSGEVTDLVGINGNSTVNVKDMNVTTAEVGLFTFGEESYTITDDDNVTFEIGSNGLVENISGFTGGVKADRALSTSINGIDIYVSNADATIYGGGTAGITFIDGLGLNATVQSSALDSIVLGMGGSSGSTNSSLSTNDVGYELIGDSDGVYVTGKNITGLASEASLKVAAAGTYTINGTALTAAIDDIFVGTSEGSAYIYDPENIRITENTTTEEILEELGVSEGYAYDSTNTTLAAVMVAAGNLNGNMSMALDSTSADFSDTTGRKRVELLSGNQTVSFNDGGSNVAIVDEDASGSKTVELGDGGDIVIVEDTSASVSVAAGEGADTIISKGDNVTVDVGEGGADLIVVTDGSVVLENYNASTGAAIQVDSNDILKSINSEDIQFGDGAVTLGSAEVVVDAEADSTGSNIVNLTDDDGEVTKVGFTNSNGGTLDASSISSSMILIGDRDGSSTIKGGSGNDTILAGGDSIDAGAGVNYVSLSADSTRSAATIAMTSATGRTTVDGFNNDLDGGDVVNISSNASVTFDGTDLVIQDGKAKTTLTDVESYSEASDSTDDFGNVSYTKVLIANGSSTIKTAIAEEGAAIAVGSEEIESYVGKNSGLDFAGYEEAVNVNLSTGRATIGGETATVEGFTKLRAGSGNTTLTGSEANETLYAGVGNTTINSGGGRDQLVGYEDNDKAGSTRFVVTDGKATIDNFNFLTAANAETADWLDISNREAVSLRADGDDLVIATSGGKITVKDGVGEDLQFRTSTYNLVAQIDSSELTYDGVANYYQALGKNATLNVDADLNNAEIWLSNTNSSVNAQFYGDIKYLDASNVEGQSTLVGNSNNNVIKASQDDSILWGSEKGNDTLIGGDGDDTFWYFAGNGADVIQGAGSNDTVYLGDITIDMITETNFASDSIKLNFRDGGSLTLDTNAGTKFEFADGEYSYDTSDNEWKNQ